MSLERVVPENRSLLHSAPHAHACNCEQNANRWMCTQSDSNHFGRRLVFATDGILAIHPESKPMKFRPALLLCGAVLAAALPICADRIPYSGTADEFPEIEALATVPPSPSTIFKARVKTESPLKAVSAAAPGWADAISYSLVAEEPSNIAKTARVTANSDLKMVAPANKESLTEPDSAIMLTYIFETNAFDARDLNSPSIRDTFFTASSDTDIRTASLSEYDSFERASPISHAEKSWCVETTG